MKILHENNSRIVTKVNFDEAYQHVKDDLTYFVIRVAYKSIEITSKTILKFEKVNKKAIWSPDNEKGFRIASGSKSLYILPGQLVEMSF